MTIPLRNFVSRFGIGLLLGCHLVAGSSVSAPLQPEQVPESLQPWIDWALFDVEDRECPVAYRSGERRCSWQSRLALRLGDTGGTFEQTITVYRDAAYRLPGDGQHWPEEVRLDGEPALVTQRSGRPALRLTPGAHHLTGRFSWEQLPEALYIPPTAALVGLVVGDAAVALPDIGSGGRLWLGDRTVVAQSASNADDLMVQVYRRITDDHPMRVTTRIALEVSGTAREVSLSGALLKNFIPQELRSALPARIERDGTLRVQIRPGRWEIDVTGRHHGDITQLSLAPNAPPWPPEEIWVFEARNALRLVEIEGAPQIDPRQTSLPADWRQLPAWRLKPGETITLKVMRRGDPDPDPDALRLERDLWLDFDGQGYTIRDRITGSMTRGWRLSVEPDIELGRVSVDGQPQLITTLPGDPDRGVEVRHGNLDLVADSRYTALRSILPATGWNTGFRGVEATLNLPPGWKLLTASGVDNVPDTWVHRWTLLDLFIVLIVTIAVSRLWGKPWGLLALITLVLIWHEPNAPRYVWLNIVAASALLGALPQGRVRRAAVMYRIIALLSLAMIAVPFLMQEARVALFPQLEQSWRTVGQDGAANAPAARDKVRVAPSMTGAFVERSSSPSSYDKGLYESYSSRTSDEIDPVATIQTGPGLPDWQWNTVRMSWNGPVDPDQRIRLVLIPPSANLVLNLFRIVLLLALAWVLVRHGSRPPLIRKPASRQATGAAAMAAIAGAISLVPVARADFPDAGMLTVLKQRLSEPPDCLPACADVPGMHVSVESRRVTLGLEINALTRTAVPLPLDPVTWMPETVMDGDAAAELMRDSQGSLWLMLEPGRHEVLISGAAPVSGRLQLPLQLRPHRVAVDADGWRLEGLRENNVPGDQLQLVRIADSAGDNERDNIEPAELPAFVRIERTLRLGLDWRVETRVTRISPSDASIFLRIPVLDGESVLTEGIHVTDGEALVSMKPGQNQVTWRSTLEKTPEINLTASNNPAWVEVWRADIGPTWHAAIEGIPAVHNEDPRRRWLPRWQPWPGETVTITLTRPSGVKGPTLTVDRSELEVSPGKRTTGATLELDLRSSQGGQHALRLPDGARLESVTVDGRSQPIRQEGNAVTLPVVPGPRSFELTWSQTSGIDTRFETPGVTLNVPSVNSTVRVLFPGDRWVLFTTGPRLGPAVLFWGALLVVVLLAVALGRIRGWPPLKTHEWLLLGVGLLPSVSWGIILLIGWLFALAARKRVPEGLSVWRFNFVQIGLVILTIAALSMLLLSVQKGLLGVPDMQVAGNGSSASRMNWYQDRVDETLPQAVVISVPLFVYRLIMLAWALWLALALLRWLRWGWEAFSTGGLWRKIRFKLPAKKRTAVHRDGGKTENVTGSRDEDGQPA
ncbi:MAG: hypothetical protein U9R74_03990 [Pseudomonadota bacterium]|nr:hypothetical protein [Pseudomonadota bacterium]